MDVMVYLFRKKINRVGGGDRYIYFRLKSSHGISNIGNGFAG